jgi:hypothetical protein
MKKKLQYLREFLPPRITYEVVLTYATLLVIATALFFLIFFV